MAATEDEVVLKVNVEAHKLINEENVKATLANDKGSAATYTAHEIIDFTALGDNYACFVTSVKVLFTMNGQDDEETYIVKLNPCRSGMPEFEFMTTLIFEKECQAYTVIVPQLNAILSELGQPELRVPKCYYASSEPKKEMIYLEDMRNKGFKMANRFEGLEKPYVFLVLEELARFHSAGLLLQQKCQLDDLRVKYSFLSDFFTGQKDEKSEAIFSQMFQGFLKTGADIAEKLDNYKGVAGQLMEMIPNVMDGLKEELKSSPPFTVVTHGDCWNNNLLFRLVTSIF